MGETGDAGRYRGGGGEVSEIKKRGEGLMIILFIRVVIVVKSLLGMDGNDVTVR